MLLNRRAGRSATERSAAGRPGLRDRLAAARRAFGPWRKERPFVGCVLVILAGLELLLSGPIDIGALADSVGAKGVPNLQLGIGIEGVQATVLPLALILLGVLSMVQPVHRVFYGVVILAISVYTLSGVNLGGWIVGFLLGVIGGIVIVSWSPSDDAGARAGADASSPGRATGDDAGTPDAGTPDTDHRPSDGANPLHTKSAVIALAGVLALGGMQPTALRAAGDDCWDPIPWIPVVTCDEEGGDVEPSSSPSSTESGDPVGDVVDEVTDGIDDAVDGVTGGSQDDPAGEDSDQESGDDPESAESDEAAAGIFSTDESEKGLSIGYVCDGEKQNVTLPMIPAGQDNRNTFSLPADLRTTDLEISGIQSVALVSVPVTHEVGRRDAIRIVADHVKAPGFWLKSYAHDTDADGEPVTAGTDTSANYVSMDGDATMYISGINLGCPDFEDIADEPPESIVAWLLALSDAQIDLLGATSDVQVWSNFREQVWGDPVHPIGEGPEAGDP